MVQAQASVAEPAAPAAGLIARVAGEGAELVLVHGSLGDYRQWDRMATRLQAGYRTIAISRRFHWPHPAAPSDRPYSYDGHRDDLIHYLRGGGRAMHLVGHSYGAGVVLLAALAEPSLVRSLVLIEPALSSLLPTDAPGLRDELVSRNAMVADVRSLAQTGRDAEAARRLIDWVQGDAGEFTSLPGWAQDAILDNAVTAGPTLAHTAPDVSCEQLRQLRVPALVLTGERTRLYYRSIAARIAECLPQAVAATLPRAAHMTIVERPDETASLLISFLAEHARS